MLNALAIEGYRGIKSLRIEPLSRINLFVGRNNSGKSSVLECVELLLSDHPVRTLWEIAVRRGEIHQEIDSDRGAEIEVRHFFWGHSICPQSEFSISGQPSFKSSITCRVQELVPAHKQTQTIRVPSVGADEPPSDYVSADEEGAQYTLSVEDSARNRRGSVMLTPRDGMFRPMPRSPRAMPYPPVYCVSTESLRADELAEMWDQIALTPDEDRVLDILRILEPAIERIAFLSGRSPKRAQGIVVKLKDQADRLPLGNFGDGVRRLLALSFALVRSAGGALLIDEIDTGLHYSVIADTWRLLAVAAEKLDVQVFATTHSQDCLDGLAALCESGDAVGNGVTLHRLEQCAERSQYYSPEQIVQLSRHNIESR